MPKAPMRLEIKMTPSWDQIADDYEENIAKGMQELGERAEKIWKAIADDKLNTTKEAYKKSIKMDVTGTEVQLSLNDWLPVAIEMGTPAFDMKQLHMVSGKSVIPVGFNKKQPEVPGFRTMVLTASTKKKGTSSKKHAETTANWENSWKHPGFPEPGRRLHEKMFEQLEGGIIADVFVSLLSNRTVI